MAKHTKEPWEYGIPCDAVVSTNPEESRGEDEYYGGAVVAESIMAKDRPLIKAAPRLLHLLGWAIEWLGLYVEPDNPNNHPEWQDNWDEAQRLLKELR